MISIFTLFNEILFEPIKVVLNSCPAGTVPKLLLLYVVVLDTVVLVDKWAGDCVGLGLYVTAVPPAFGLLCMDCVRDDRRFGVLTRCSCTWSWVVVVPAAVPVTKVVVLLVVTTNKPSCCWWWWWSCCCTVGVTICCGWWCCWNGNCICDGLIDGCKICCDDGLGVKNGPGGDRIPIAKINLI